MLRRGAPLTPDLTVGLAALAALSVANIDACLTRAHAFALTVLLWHGGPVAAIGTLCALAARGASLCCIRRAMHPRRLRGASLTYSRYARSSRLAGGAPRSSRCDARLAPRAASGPSLVAMA